VLIMAGKPKVFAYARSKRMTARQNDKLAEVAKKLVRANLDRDMPGLQESA
jgi:hypothetical protein